MSQFLARTWSIAAGPLGVLLSPRWYFSWPLVSAFVLACALGYVDSLIVHLLGISMYAGAVSGTTIGTSTAAQAAGTIIGSFASTRLSARLGVVASISGACMISSLGLVALVFSETTLAQTLARMLFAIGLGVSGALLNLVVMANVPRQHVGKSIAIFSLIFAVGTMFAPMTVGLIGPDIRINSIICIVLLLAAGAMFHFTDHAPLPRPPRRMQSLRETFRIAPCLFLPAFVFGALDNGFMALLGTWSMARGADLALASAVTSVGLLGALLQIPLGILSDRSSTRLLLVVFGAAALVLLSALGAAVTSPSMVFASVFLLGIVSDGFYTVGLADMAMRLPADRLAAGNSCFVAFCGIGELAGPSACGIGLHLGGAAGMALATAALVGICAFLILARPAEAKLAGKAIGLTVTGD